VTPRGRRCGPEKMQPPRNVPSSAAYHERIDEEDAAERLDWLLVDDDDLLAGLGQFRRGDEAGKAGADNDHIGIVSHSLLPRLSSRL
jgi:hypothetical protein